MIIGARFVANLDYMKLKQISEAGMSRRDFLGRSFGAVLSVSPLEQPVTGNPLVTWWKNYGSWGDEIIGPHAKQVLDELGLRRENDSGDEYELEDEEDEYDEKDEDVENTRSKWAKDPAASSMHQWFESKLNRALLGRRL